MSPQQKLIHEVKAVGLAALYFGGWIAAMILLKQLVLEEYQIHFYGYSQALVGALILSKVVLVLEHVSLGAWVRARPAWVDVLLRTMLYAVGVVLVMLLEKGFEGRHEYGGFGSALRALFEHADIHHIWTNATVLMGALLVYNVLAVVRAHLGEGGLWRLFMMPVPQGVAGKPPPSLEKGA